MATALLLPGMDGTGALFGPFSRALAMPSTIARYPRDTVLSYDELFERVVLPEANALLEGDARLVVVGESFSGPLAVRLCARLGDRVKALVLVASFVRTPAPLLPAWAPSLLPSAVFAVAPPALAVRAALLGDDASDADVRELQATLATVDARVLAARLRAIHRVDVCRELAALDRPALYLAGARDRLLGLSSAAHARSVNARVELAILDAPHLVVQRRPREAADLVRAFLARHGA